MKSFGRSYLIISKRCTSTTPCGTIRRAIDSGQEMGWKGDWYIDLWPLGRHWPDPRRWLHRSCWTSRCSPCRLCMHQSRGPLLWIYCSPILTAWARKPHEHYYYNAYLRHVYFLWKINRYIIVFIYLKGDITTFRHVAILMKEPLWCMILNMYLKAIGFRIFLKRCFAWILRLFFLYQNYYAHLYSQFHCVGDSNKSINRSINQSICQVLVWSSQQIESKSHLF